MSARKSSSIVKSPDSITCKNFNWFSDNQVKENGDNCQVLLTSEVLLSVVADVDSAQIKYCFSQKNYWESLLTIN